MSSSGPTPQRAVRKPRVFTPDDPSLNVSELPTIEPPPASSNPPEKDRSARDGGFDARTARTSDLTEKGFRWGAVLLSAVAGAVVLSLALWFWRLVSVGLERNDAIGWIVRGLVAIAVLAAAIIVLKELAGILRLGRLTRLRSDALSAVERRDTKAERIAVDRLLVLYGQKPERRWAVERVRSHRQDVLDPGAFLALVDREVLSGIDQDARAHITTSAKRVATVTAMMPMMSLAFLFLVFETLRMLRKIATSYGGRPGFAGSVRLARTIVGNLIAAGGVALTDDLLGQFVGQDVLRRLSRRLGEGVFNGALVARIGVASLDVIRPLPFSDSNRVRVRDIVSSLFRRHRDETKSQAT